MPRLTKKKQIEKGEKNAILENEMCIFRSLCRYFDISLEEIHHNIAIRCKGLKRYYSTQVRFTRMLLNQPLAIMRKDDLRKTILEISGMLKEDAGRTFMQPRTYNNIRAKWTI